MIMRCRFSTYPDLDNLTNQDGGAVAATRYTAAFRRSNGRMWTVLFTRQHTPLHQHAKTDTHTQAAAAQPEVLTAFNAHSQGQGRAV
jgi:hypothetical protein